MNIVSTALGVTLVSVASFHHVHHPVDGCNPRVELCPVSEAWFLPMNRRITERRDSLRRRP